MSLHDVVELFADYESRRSRAQVDPADAERRIKAFVGQPDYDDLANEPRIILGAEEFSAEITATVLWLRSFGVDISCVRLRPYSVDNNLLLDSSVTIPLAEAREFQIRRDSKEAARALREPREVLSPEEFLNTGPEELRPVMTHMRNWLLAQPDIREEVFKTLLAYRQSSDRAWVTWLQFTRSDVRVAIAPGIEVDPTQIARTSSSGFRIVRVRTIADAEQVEQSIATARVVAVDTAQR